MQLFVNIHAECLWVSYIHIHECLWVAYVTHFWERMRKTCGGLCFCMLADATICVLVFATTHIRIFPCVCRSVGAWVCYCDILNPSLSSVRSSAAGASGPLIYLPGLCCWALLQWSWLAVITKPLWEDTPHWFRADLRGVEVKDKEVCACVDFIDESKLYFGYCVTFEWFMDMQRWMYKEVTHEHLFTEHMHTLSTVCV